MIICHEHKFIFVHVPRTGGHSVREMWKQYEHPHRKVKYHARLNEGIKRFADGRNVNDYFSFGFIRNPWERVYSLFCKHVNKSPVDTSRGFKHWMFDKTRTDSQRHKQPAMFFLQNADYIAKYENFEEEWDIIFEKIGIPREPLPHKFKFKDDKSYQDLYDDDMRAFIVKHHQQDINRGSYIF